MLVRGGLSGKKRLVRHLWRMSFALFIATGSFFLGQQQVFPAFLRGSVLLLVLRIMPLVLMVFWLLHVGFAKDKKTASPSRTTEVRVVLGGHSLPG